MQNWEYKSISLKTKGGMLKKTAMKDDVVESCNAAGREGWELVSALPLTEANGRTVALELIFKRPR
jgi:hypothetical protein